MSIEAVTVDDVDAAIKVIKYVRENHSAIRGEFLSLEHAGVWSDIYCDLTDVIRAWVSEDHEQVSRVAKAIYNSRFPSLEWNADSPDYEEFMSHARAALKVMK